MVKCTHNLLNRWILWVDRDTIILDQCRPISSFLPPPPENDRRQVHIDTHMLISNDMNGLNNGVFAMRVSHWSINLLMDILAFRDFKPEVLLPFTEQSAMELVLKEPKFAPHVQFVPQEWFNAYPQGDNPLEYEQRSNEEGLEKFHVRRGDFLVHFAGRGARSKEINQWMKMLRRVGNIWEDGRIQRDYSEDIKRFWERIEEDRKRISD